MRASANDNGVRMADVVVVAGGLAGQLAVIAMAERAPHLTVTVAIYRLVSPTFARFHAGGTSRGDQLAWLSAPLRLAYPKAKALRHSLLGTCS